MKRSIASAADPDGQPLMDTLLNLEVDPSEAYNTVQGTHNMAGKNVIAAMDARFVETNSKFVETNSKFVEVDARFVEVNANFSETQAMIKSLGAELRFQRWILGLLVALVGVLMTVVVALVLYLVPGDPAPIEVTVAAAVAEELDPSARLPATDPEEAAAEEAAAEDAPQ